MSGQGESLSSVTPDQELIPSQEWKKRTPASLVLRKELILDTFNPRKISQEDTIIDLEKGSQHKTSRPFWNKEYYEGDTDKNNLYTNDSQTVNDDFVRKL